MTGNGVIEDLAGRYISSSQDTVTARSIILEIIPGDNANPLFTLRITDAGEFGSVGTVYSGNYVIEKDIITLQAITRTKWRDTIIEEEEEYECPSPETFEIKLNMQDGRVKISLTVYDHEMVLEKEPPKHI